MSTQRQHVSRMVPIERRKGVNNFDQLLTLTQEYKLGDKAYSLFGEKGRGIIKILKPIIRKNATDENGVFSSNWKGMTSIQQAALGKAVHEREPWMLRHFEGGWATDWALKKMIDQRVFDRTRRQKQQVRQQAPVSRAPRADPRPVLHATPDPVPRRRVRRHRVNPPSPNSDDNDRSSGAVPRAPRAPRPIPHANAPDAVPRRRDNPPSIDSDDFSIDSDSGSDSANSEPVEPIGRARGTGVKRNRDEAAGEVPTENKRKKTTEEIERESADMREATRQQKKTKKKELAAQKELQRRAILASLRAILTATSVVLR
ncbi:hypothetical protein Egran_04950 [Elaphomyces granulatus]|uniref:Uncharacterized protein n=1 Tax=Elaphomyces granulatus TaxID=519963 RepID=A0A232LT13_9EURO|nr:hypothetical protein Egran_04950 [Elaphomyces granulatus]